jgi:hypothetical protein
MRQLPVKFFSAWVLLLLTSLPAVAGEWVYTVVEGDNLWDFSTRHLDSTLRYEALRRLNAIEQPRRMRPGTRIRVPMKWIRSNPAHATIAAVQGNVALMRSDGTLAPEPATGTLILLGDTLRTAAESSVSIRFADASKITLYQNGEMRFDHLSAHGETGMVDSRVRLNGGRVDTHVTPAVGPGSRFEIHTPSAISAVRGTRYRAAVLDQDISAIEVTGGRVLASGASASRMVRDGFGTRVAVGAAPEKPRPLLPAPQLAAQPERIRALNHVLEWTALSGAQAYRVQISRRTAPDVLAWEQLTERPRLPLPDLADGAYAARVRGVDASGLEGRDTIFDLHIDTRPRAPVPLQPGDGKVLRGTPAKLRWSASADAHRYILEIAATPDFNAPVTQVANLEETQYVTAAGTPPGTYYWRVKSVATDGKVGPAGDVRHWQVKAVPDKVEANVSEDDDGLVASWREGPPGARYQVQLGEDPDFRALQIDKTVAMPRIGIVPVGGQVRYLRVRIVEDDGYLGPWGVVQRIDPLPDTTAWFVPILGVLGLLLL